MHSTPELNALTKLWIFACHFSGRKARESRSRDPTAPEERLKATNRKTQEAPLIAATLEDEDKRVSATLREAVEAEPEEVQSSAYVLDTLRTALWAVLRTASFEEAVVLAVNLGNDADTVGAVTGALAGAVYGEAGIPPRWLAALQGREYIAAVAERLADLALGVGD